MKTYLHPLYKTIAAIMLLLSVFLAGCHDNAVDDSLVFSNDDLLLKAAGDTAIIDVTAGSHWNAESMADWCTIEKGQGVNEGKLIICVAPSDDIYERGTAVKVTCGDNIVRLSVRQNGMVFEVEEDKKNLDFNRKPSTEVLKIRTNMAWKVEIADKSGWLQVSDTIGTGNADLVFNSSDNSQAYERTSVVRIHYGIRSVKLTATQEGGIRQDGHIKAHLSNRPLDKALNLVFLGDGFIAEDLITETGAFEQAVEEACEALFEIEPYKTYKDYFNIYSIASESKQREIPSVAPTTSSATTPFYTYFTEMNTFQTKLSYSKPSIEAYCSKILGMTTDILERNTVVVVLVNDERYGGQTYFLPNGLTISLVPLNRDTQLPGGFTNLFLHEVGGHAIGHLADEWSESDRLFTTQAQSYLTEKRKALFSGDQPARTGFYGNIAAHRLPYPSFLWQHYYSYVFKGHNDYIERLQIYHGGLGYTSDQDAKLNICHSTEKNCMIDHLPWFNDICRYLIAYRINVIAGETEDSSSNLWTDSKFPVLFFEKDKPTTPPILSVSTDRPHLPEPIWETYE